MARRSVPRISSARIHQLAASPASANAARHASRAFSGRQSIATDAAMVPASTPKNDIPSIPPIPVEMRASPPMSRTSAYFAGEYIALWRPISSTAATTVHAECSRNPAIATAMMGNSAHFARRTIFTFAHTVARRSASGENRMYGNTSAPAVAPMNSGLSRSSSIHPMTVKLASVFRKLSLTVPNRFVQYSGAKERPAFTARPRSRWPHRSPRESSATRFPPPEPPRPPPARRTPAPPAAPAPAAAR